MNREDCLEKALTDLLDRDDLDRVKYAHRVLLMPKNIGGTSNIKQWVSDNDNALAKLIWKHLPREVADGLTFERSPEYIPQATYSVCKVNATNFVEAVIAAYFAAAPCRDTAQEDGKS